MRFKMKLMMIRFTLIPENFKLIKSFLRFHGVRSVDGILADLGVSSHQFDSAERGFSTRFDADLDMRMNTRMTISAYEVINDYERRSLVKVLFQYGELRNSRALAKEIVQSRE